MTSRLLPLVLTLLLGGCDLEAMLADPKVAQREADAKAIGSACRYGLRSIEDCYTLNEKASKAAIFTGWKDMDQYMRDNKVDGIEAKIVKAAPQVPAEEIITESNVDEAPKDKAEADSKGKSKAKAPEKAAAH